MDLLSPMSVRGHVIALQTSDPRHLSGSQGPTRLTGLTKSAGAPDSGAAAGPEAGFGKIFFGRGYRDIS